MTEQQRLTTLQTLLTDSGVGTIEYPLLERFYKHCARQPALLHQRLVPLRLQTLLYHYRFLRPEIQASLAEFITLHWRVFAAGSVLPETTDDAPPTHPDPALTVHEPPPIVNRFASRARRDDWFDRFLDGVRILFFR